MPVLSFQSSEDKTRHYYQISEIVRGCGGGDWIEKTSFQIPVLCSQTRSMVTDFTTASFSGLSWRLRGVATIFSATS
jgi:hypothetical protein